MNKNFLIVLVSSVLIISCAKESDPYVCTPTNPTTVAPDSEVAKLQTYLANKGLIGVVTRHASNFYYKIDEEGTGITPTTCSNVRVTYTGKLANDSVFTTPTEATDARTFSLNRMIEGWQYGMQLIKKGGKIKLYLPPALAYGGNTIGDIPPNSILVFDVSMVDVTN